MNRILPIPLNKKISFHMLITLINIGLVTSLVDQHLKVMWEELADISNKSNYFIHLSKLTIYANLFVMIKTLRIWLKH